ncbi:MAG: Hint domain-containing protein [Cognatishimia sp.]|uniref:Hint domain-containing protein n=1 Tax=Cognatishimia sp. TaxID=2211648 RepID=UPI003B8CF866
MPTTYTDQFWILDPFAPPAAGTTLEVQVYDLIDQDDDDDIGRRGGDSINGVDVRRSYPGDVVTVTLADGSTVSITGTTFYLANGVEVFTPTDGSVLQDATFVSSSFTTTQGDLDVNTDLGPPCLTQGALVKTSVGELPVEDLRPGMVVIGLDGRKLVLRVVLKTSISARDMQENPKLYPVRIVAGALGNGLPNRDLIVSRQHRMLVNAPIVKRMFGYEDVLMAAIKLTEIPGIFVDQSLTSLTYSHLVFDQHEVIFAEGAATESLFTGPEALRSVPVDALTELLTLFPDLQTQPDMSLPACPILEGGAQKQLAGYFATRVQPVLQRT